MICAGWLSELQRINDFILKVGVFAMGVTYLLVQHLQRT